MQGVTVALFDKRKIQEHLLRRARDGQREGIALQHRAEAFRDSAEQVRSASTRTDRQSDIDRLRSSMWAHRIAMLRIEATKFRRANYFLEGLPRPIAQTLTDARGRFALSMPKGGSHALVAHIEYWEAHANWRYTWIIAIPADRERGGELDLSDELLTSGNAPLSMIHTERDIEPTF